MMSDQQSSIQQPTDSIRPHLYAWYALGVLLIVYVLNFLDRTLIYMLFPPIRKEMVLTDFQLALLGTTSFVIFYTLLGIPFGRLADRYSRKVIIGAGLAVWSFFSGATGFATNFETIFFCRVMVGVGEAALGPAALSLLADYFPKSMRATVQSIYSAGIPLGAASAFFLGGSIAQNIGWREAFFILGFPGLVLAMFVLNLRHPHDVQPQAMQSDEQKQHHAHQDEVASGRGILCELRTIFALPGLLWHHVGYAVFTIATNSLSIWMPLYLSRQYGMALADIGLLAGIAMLVGGGTATMAGGYMSDMLYRRRRGGRMIFSAISAMLCAVVWLILLNNHRIGGGMTVVITSYILLAGLGLIWLGPSFADVHDIVGMRLRGVGVGVFFFFTNIIGYGIAPPLIGRLNDALGGTTDPSMMSYALLVCPLASAVAALLLWRGAVRIEAE